ncbi:MAG: hypothetical protein JNM22_16870 [Saprospiraceae bacterium]|nr:hypothetical protein [Saprospiraceae bacterium]
MFQLTHIEALLEKFWEGDTTLEEERLLKAYFASGQVDDSLKSYAPFFQVLRQEQAVELQRPPVVTEVRPVTYNWKPWLAAASVALLLTTGWWWSSRPNVDVPYTAEVTPETTPVTQPEAATQPQTAQITSETPVQSRGFFRHKTTTRKPSPAPQINEEEEKAMLEIKAALALVSSKLKKGRREAVKGTEHLETMDRVFKKKRDGEG